MSDAIEAASVACKTMADGTLRLSVDIEPRHARAAFGLFGSPGTPMALAALRTAAQQESEPKPEAPKGGALARLAGQWCQDAGFIDWLMHAHTPQWGEAQAALPDEAPDDWAAWAVRCICEVDSRAELDHQPDAAERFQRLIRRPYMQHCGLAA